MLWKCGNDGIKMNDIHGPLKQIDREMYHVIHILCNNKSLQLRYDVTENTVRNSTRFLQVERFLPEEVFYVSEEHLLYPLIDSIGRQSQELGERMQLVNKDPAVFKG